MSLTMVLWFLIAQLVGGKESKVSFKVSPMVCSAPCKGTITITVPPEAHNRKILVVIDGKDEYHESESKLEGDEGPRTTLILFTLIYPGTYDIKVVLYDTTKEIARATANYRVYGPDSDLH